MKEKENVKISLGTVICIFIIILLVIALFVMWFYYNSKDNNKTNELATNVVNTETKTEKTNTIFKGGEYNYLGLNLEDKAKHVVKKASITFFDNRFTADLTGIVVNGQYEVNGNELTCIIESYIDNDNPEKKPNNLFNGKKIIFNILDNKIKVKEYDFAVTENEISVILYEYFKNNQEYIKHEVKSYNVVGTWNTKYYWEFKDFSDNLSDIFGTSSQLGSYLKLLDDNKFEDYVYPITEGDAHRKGTYAFDGEDKIILTYDDDASYKVELYIIDENNILYEDGQNHLVLCK